MDHQDKELIYNDRDGRGGKRLDIFLADGTTGYSRSRIQALIKGGFIKVNDCEAKPSRVLRDGDRILIDPPPVSDTILDAEPVRFGILHEDSAIVVVNKPAGMVVHPAPGNKTGTLVHGLLYHCNDLSGIGGVSRPGIVHRLDKDTSGVLVVAKTDGAHENLTRQFASGMVEKDYLALVHGVPAEKKGTIESAIGRHPVKRKQMTVRPETSGRLSITLWTRKKAYGKDFSLLSVRIKTGRTHQIRVHMAEMGFPVVGDLIYGRGMSRWKRNPLRCDGVLPELSRHLLHASKLAFTHPVSGVRVSFSSVVPEDFELVIKSLESVYSEKY